MWGPSDLVQTVRPVGSSPLGDTIFALWGGFPPFLGLEEVLFVLLHGFWAFRGAPRTRIPFPNILEALAVKVLLGPMILLACYFCRRYSFNEQFGMVVLVVFVSDMIHKWFGFCRIIFLLGFGPVTNFGPINSLTSQRLLVMRSLSPIFEICCLTQEKSLF